MKLEVTCLKPLEVLEGQRLERSARFRQDRVLMIKPGQAAFISDESGLTFYSPAGSLESEVVVSPHARVNLTKRDCVIYLRLTEVAFANASGAEGAVDLAGVIRFIGAETADGHPLCRTMLPKEERPPLVQALESSIFAALGSEMSSLLQATKYSPLEFAALTSGLQKLWRDEACRRALARTAGVQFASMLEPQNASVPSIDDAYSRDEARRMHEDARRREVREAIGNIGATSAVERAQHERALQRERERIELELSKKKGELAEREIAAAAEVLEQQKRAARAEVDKAEAEARLTEQAAKLTEAQRGALLREIAAKERQAQEAQAAAERSSAAISELDGSVQDLARRLLQDRDSLLEKMEVLASELQGLRQETPAGEDSLSVVAEWRAYNQDGVIIPRLGVCERLYTETMLDVAVSVNRDAYVYILLKDSRGQWVSLVPENLPDVVKLGISRSNHQRAGEVVVWPGANYRKPELPFWMLDAEPGYERFVVLASVEELGDPIQLLREQGLASVRGVCNPVCMTGPSNPEPTTLDYERALRVLTGPGCVAQETVVEHV